MVAGDRELGRRIAVYRQRRGLSQAEFGQLIGRSEAWVSQVERGVRPVRSLDVLERIAHVAEVPLAELAPTAPAAAAQQRPAGAVSLRHLLSGNYALHAALETVRLPADANQLRQRTEQAWDLAHAAAYSELVGLLETLLPALESAARQDAATRGQVLPLLARAYHACAAALSTLQQFDAAWVAADRATGYAEQAGDPLLMAEGAFRLTLIFHGARFFDQAKHIATTASNALSGLVAQGQPAALSLFGALQLQLAVIAARQQDASSAQRFLSQGHDMATRLGRDRNDYHTEFGPTNVAVHEVSVAVELGDAGDAVRRAETIDTSSLSAERRGRLLIDVARAWAQRRNVNQALAALEVAEQTAPEQVRQHRLVHTVVRDLLRMEPHPPAGLHDLAQRLALPAIP